MSRTKDRKKSQYVTVGIFAVAGIGLFVVIGTLLNSGPDTALPGRPQETVDQTIIRDRTSAASPEMSWITRGQAQMERLNAELDELQQQLELARNENERQAEEMRDTYDQQLLQQAMRIQELEGSLTEATQAAQAASSAGQITPDTDPNSVPAPYESTGTDFINRRTVDRQTTSGRTRAATDDAVGVEAVIGPWQPLGTTFTLTKAEEPNADVRDVRTLGNYIPAGSYAPAVVLSGADAATNVSNRENPIPVLLRITGPAVTASLGNRSPARIDITGCTVQGSATGDLSSERVKVRLISMTCVNRRGEVLETRVAGYMAGSGKEGVRGKVVSREGPMVGNAMVAGVVGGLGSALNSAAASQLSQDNPTLQQSLQGGLANTIASGVSTAANSLADYYIDRAEQYQPVVSLYGGTKVEIVFLEGVDLSE